MFCKSILITRQPIICAISVCGLLGIVFPSEGVAASKSDANAQLTRVWQKEFAAPPLLSPSPYSASSFSMPQNSAIPFTRPPAAFSDHLRSDHPHPAVARIIVPEAGATSYGSGTFVDARDQFGLVITNWHVVRDAQGVVEVLFPDGFRSKARALKVDPDWDLAALVIWRPSIEPVKLASAAPKPGDQLTICGYGQGMYRAATGRCTRYYAPRLDFPQHMVELDVEARQGDSGGPIFNRQGELAGVLFGAGQGTTLGSFGGRVQSFLASLAPDIGKAADAALVCCNSQADDKPMVCQEGVCCAVPKGDSASIHPHQSAESAANGELGNEGQSWSEPEPQLAGLWAAAGGNDSGSSRATPFSDSPNQSQLSDGTDASRMAFQNGWFDQTKTVLAAIGLLSLGVMMLKAAG